MSLEGMAIVLHHSKAKGTAKLVLLGIANHDGDGGAWPSVRTLAKYANVDVTNVRRALQTLQGLGEVTVELQAGGPAEMDPHDRPNRYTLRVCCPPWCDRTKHHRDSRSRQERLVDKPPREIAPPTRKRTTPHAVAPEDPHAPAPAEPSSEPHLKLVGPADASTTDRAGAEVRYPSRERCGICGYDRIECARRSPVSDHLFEPTRKRP